MPLISFFMRRFLTGAIARGAANFLTRRLKMSPGAANIAFLILTEVLARATEKKGGATKNGGRGFGRRK